MVNACYASIWAKKLQVEVNRYIFCGIIILLRLIYFFVVALWHCVVKSKEAMVSHYISSPSKHWNFFSVIHHIVIAIEVP